jgi:hypothetical protein
VNPACLIRPVTVAFFMLFVAVASAEGLHGIAARLGPALSARGGHQA